MKSEEFSKNILALDPTIRFAGFIERSGHLFAGGMREGADTHFAAGNSPHHTNQLLVGGYPSTETDVDFGDHLYTEVVTMKNDTAYSLRYSAGSDEYNQFLPIAQKMIESFRILS